MKILLRQVIRLFSRKERFQIAGLLLLMLLGALVEALGIGLVIPFIGILNNPAIIHEQPILSRAYSFLGIQTETRFMLLATGALVLMFVAKNCLLAVLGFAQARFVAQKEAMIARALLERYLASSYALHLDRNSAELIRTVTIDVPRVTNGFLQPLLLVIAELFVVGMITALLIYVDPIIALLVGFAMATMGLLMLRYFRAKLSEYRHESRRFGIQAQKWASQALGALKEVKVFRSEKYFNSMFATNISGYTKGYQAFVFLNQMPRLVIETLAVTVLLIVVAVVLWQRSDVREVVPLLAVFALSSIRIMPSLTRIVSSINSLRFCKPALDAVSRDLRPHAHAAGETSAATLSDCSRDGLAIRFDGVWYRHPGMEKWIVQGISFAVAHGECIAIVGYSGAGKSTVADLILGLLHPSLGTVAVDGGVESRGRIGYVPQHPYLLDESVRRNVAFGVPDDEIDDQRVWKALDMSRLADKVRALKEGLAAEVGERGIKLSGGERQRLSIARALYSDPDIVIFDEATSSLDQYTEREINDTISGLAGSKTLIVVTHRLAAAARCDRILFLEQGSVSAEGKFDELLGSSAAFRKMAGELADQSV